MNVLAVFFTAIKMLCYTRRNPKNVLGQDAAPMYIFKFLLYLFDSWSELMFWLLFFFSSSIFVTYKMQMNAYLLLPEMGEASNGLYTSFKAVMLVTLIMKFLTVMFKIWEQTSMDIFFVDFESPNAETK